MKRGPKPGKAGAKRAVVLRDDLGDCPASLVGPGREFWTDAVAHLKATGRASRVYRHPLLLVGRLLEGVPAQGEVGINKADAIRRWLHELALTPAAHKGSTEGSPEHGDGTATGKARILQIINRRAEGA